MIDMMSMADGGAELAVTRSEHRDLPRSRDTHRDHKNVRVGALSSNLVGMMD